MAIVDLSVSDKSFFMHKKEWLLHTTQPITYKIVNSAFTKACPSFAKS